AVGAAAASIAQAQAVATAAAGTPGAAAAQANLAKTAIEQVANVSNAMVGSGADTFTCPIVKVVIPDGMGVVMTGSQTVLINKFPASRMGDMIQEATAPSTVAAGCPTVMIGG
ncbi:MAG: PAAR domain-containing protein, partial [Gemmatimonadaceae bacterium]